jgi:hypothetical protein
MKIICTAILLSLFVYITALAQQDIETSPKPYRIKLGFSTGYTLGDNINWDSGKKLQGSAQDKILNQAINSSAISGFYFGLMGEYPIFRNSNISHNIQLRLTYENFTSQSTVSSPYPTVDSTGRHVVASLDQDYSVNLQYLSVNLLYKFSLAKNHVGLLIGPILQVLMNNSYEISEERLVLNNTTTTKGTVVDAKLSDKLTSFWGLCLGLEFPLSVSKFELVPQVFYSFASPDAISAWKSRNLRVGIEIRTKI